MKAQLSREQLSNLNPTLRMKLPFLIAAFLSFVFSVYLYFILDEESAGIFVGLWVPSIHSLGILMLTPTVKAEPSRVPVQS
jgi:hypothetical protein